MNFEQLGLDDMILRAVEAAGYTVPTPIQAQAIPHVMEGRDVLGCAQTGTGKTAAFSLPIIHRLLANKSSGNNRQIRVLILCPTRELAVQIGECFRTYAKRTKLRHTVIFGGVNQYRQTQDLERGVDVVIATPGRLLDLMEQRYVDLGWVETLVLDEADHMLDMGFLPDVKRIIMQVPKQRQTLFFSATMPPDIRQLADQILVDPMRLSMTPQKPAAERVEQKVYFASQRIKPTLLAHVLQNNPASGTLVFVRTKYGADAVVHKLSKAGIKSDALHGNKSQNARQRILNAFKSGECPILIATDIAARGIDVSSISHVVNYDMPNLAETYVHRIGRTGRAGASGIAISFCNPEERKHLTAIQKHLGAKIPVADDNPEFLRQDAAAGPSRGSDDDGGQRRQDRRGGRNATPRGTTTRGPGLGARQGGGLVTRQPSKSSGNSGEGGQVDARRAALDQEADMILDPKLAKKLPPTKTPNRHKYAKKKSAAPAAGQAAVPRKKKKRSRAVAAKSQRSLGN